MAETSYPFLRIARDYGVPYGQVLAYRDARLALRAARHHTPLSEVFDPWEDAAMIALNGTLAGAAILRAMDSEAARRARVRAQSSQQGA